MVVISDCEDAITSAGFNQFGGEEVSLKTEGETRTSVCNSVRFLSAFFFFPHAIEKIRVRSRGVPFFFWIFLVCLFFN